VRAVAAGAVALTAAVAAMASVDVRAWFGHAYLVLGYWIPALLTSPSSNGWFERWLIRTDNVWRRMLWPAPPSVVAFGEACYLLCYPLVPAAFLVTWICGTPADIDRFWTAALASGFACYGSLPWLVSRRPRLVETLAVPQQSRAGLARFNVAVLRRVSHQMNTFPSGHVAVAVSIAYAVHGVWPLAGWIFGIVALGIAFGAVAGRYHYAIDAVVGVLVGTIAGTAP